LSHTPRQAAGGFHLLGLNKLFPQAQVIRDVPCNAVHFNGFPFVPKSCFSQVPLFNREVLSKVLFSGAIEIQDFHAVVAFGVFDRRSFREDHDITREVVFHQEGLGKTAPVVGVLSHMDRVNAE